MPAKRRRSLNRRSPTSKATRSTEWSMRRRRSDSGGRFDPPLASRGFVTWRPPASLDSVYWSMHPIGSSTNMPIRYCDESWLVPCRNLVYSLASGDNS